MPDVSMYRDEIARLVEAPPPYPQGRFTGAGIVICAGGRSYFTCGWVLANVLRSLGCQLPIEVWYRSRKEMSGRMVQLLESIEGVRCVDASERGPRCRLRGWEIKPFAIIHCSFEDVLFIDCDNVPTRDPSFLLSTQQYRRCGAIFWPDRWMGKGDSDDVRTMTDRAWEACGLEPQDEPEFESGQMAINKRKCWRALQLTMFLNVHSELFYELVLGDKDTFHLAWRRTGLDFAMPRYRPHRDSDVAPVLYQHDFQGRRLFQHRNEDKWDYGGSNLSVLGFEHEELCFQFLDELRRQWDGVVRRYPQDYTRAEREAHRVIVTTRLFRYAHEGVDWRLIELRPDFRIGLGKGRWETDWEIEEDGGGMVELTLCNSLRKMCVLRQMGAGSWAGRSLHFERMPVVVEPAGCLPVEERKVAAQLKEKLAQPQEHARVHAGEIEAVRFYTYFPNGAPGRLMQFLSDHTIGQGATRDELWWFVEASGGNAQLTIWGMRGPTCTLKRGQDGSWIGSAVNGDERRIDPVPSAQAPTQVALNYYHRESGS